MRNPKRNKEQEEAAYVEERETRASKKAVSEARDWWECIDYDVTHSEAVEAVKFDLMALLGVEEEVDKFKVPLELVGHALVAIQTAELAMETRKLNFEIAECLDKITENQG